MAQNRLESWVLPYFHKYGMVFHMKTTLIIDDAVVKQLKVEAARQGRTMSEMVETALRRYLEPEQRGKLPPLPTFNCGGMLVDIDDRDALYDVLDKDGYKYT
jgi:plasmid stability protein